jgi:hypothetical protein
MQKDINKELDDQSPGEMVQTSTVTTPLTKAESYQKRFDLIVEHQIYPENDFITDMDLLKILLLTTGEKVKNDKGQSIPKEGFPTSYELRKEVLERLKVPEAMIPLGEKSPLNNPIFFSKNALESICKEINSGKELKRADRATIKSEYIEKFKPKERSAKAETTVTDNSIFKEIAEINPLQFLNKVAGFVPVKGKNGSNWIQELDEKRAKNIEVQDRDGRKFLISNHSETKDFMLRTRDKSFSGGLLKFVTTELLGHGDASDKKNKSEAIEYIKRNWSIGSETMDYKTMIPAKTEKSKEPIVPKDIADTPLKYPQYLLSRGIKLKTLSSDQFKGLIGNRYDRNDPTKQDITFKLSSLDNKVYAIQTKNKGQLAMFEKGSTTKDKLFKSNEGKGGYEKLVFAESAIDLLSKIELDGGVNKKSYYISSNGFVNDGQLDLIKTIVENKQINQIELNLDNDLSGKIYGAKILTALSELIEFDELKTPELLATLKMNQENYQIAGISDQEKNEILDDNLSSLTTYILSNSEMKIEINLPQGKDFNQDLMDKLGLSREDIILNDANEMWNVESKEVQQMGKKETEVEAVKKFNEDLRALDAENEKESKGQER